MIKNNYLFITNNVDTVKALTEQYARDNNLEMFSFKMNKESVDFIHELYTNNNNLCIFIEGLNKSKIADSLLKPLEDSTKNIHFFAIGKEDMSSALKSRFTIQYIKDKNYSSEIDDFINNKKLDKETISDISFYKQLATYTVKHYNKHTQDNLLLLASICNDFIASTNNLNFNYEYNRLNMQYIRS